MVNRALLLTPLLLLAACGGGDPADTAPKNNVAAKAVADVDAAMADALRTRTAPPAATGAGSPARP